MQQNVDPRPPIRIGAIDIISGQVKSKGVDKDADVLADRGFGIAYGLSQYKRTNYVFFAGSASPRATSTPTTASLAGSTAPQLDTCGATCSASVPALNSSAEIRGR